MRAFILALLLPGLPAMAAGPYAPAAGQTGSTAVPANSSSIVAWATSVAEVHLGPQQIGDPVLGSIPASFGTPSNALGHADATVITPTPVISLGDGGWITLNFAQPITNGLGADFAVFENGFSDNFLELAFVEVSSDGTNFVRFNSVSLTQTTTQVNGDDSVGPFGSVDPTNINDLAGKYRAGFGTPFDLAELSGHPGLDINHITAVRIVDVVGSINPAYATYDSLGHIINDPWATPYDSSGFDLDAIGVLNQVPEPHAMALLGVGVMGFLVRRRR